MAQEGGAVEQFGQWLWSNPIEQDPDDEMVDAQEEEGQILYLDQQAGLRYSYSQSTTLKPTLPGQSNSAPVYRNAQRFQTEYLSPTTVTRSQVSVLSLSHTRPPLRRALSLLNSTPRASNQPWVATLIPSPSAKLPPNPSEPRRLMGRTSKNQR
uniref:Movement protein n=3 Tax=Luteovirus TaxID=12036 RepID=A5A2Q4_BYDVP|nr:movement protein [Barley yellow dwarf virus PAV]AUR26504.1 movement protein [Barley yellow dwarf virus PAS]QEF75654.1 movement protein P4 [Barley yellow dwarf virus MAV]APD77444.1 movement protein [Barley yellow dwarf virus PAV]AUX13864.1 movement protein [Barley yellow dwarf virus PAV]